MLICLAWGNKDGEGEIRERQTERRERGREGERYVIQLLCMHVKYSN